MRKYFFVRYSLTPLANSPYRIFKYSRSMELTLKKLTELLDINLDEESCVLEAAIKYITANLPDANNNHLNYMYCHYLWAPITRGDHFSITNKEIVLDPPDFNCLHSIFEAVESPDNDFKAISLPLAEEELNFTMASSRMRPWVLPIKYGHLSWAKKALTHSQKQAGNA